MNRHSSVKDVTAQQSSGGTGFATLRLCSVCNKPKACPGGKVDKRTRMWRCAACIEVKG